MARSIRFAFSCLLACAAPAAGDTAVAFSAAHATSTHASGAYPATAAISEGSGYWCRVYAPGEFKVLTTSGDGNVAEATGWRQSSRAEASYEEAVMFDVPRDAKSITIVMRSAMPWGYFGLGGASVIAAAPSAVMLVAPAGPVGEDLCLAAVGGRVQAAPCLEVIAGGTGAEVFSFTRSSQLVSTMDGRCVGLAHGLAFAGNALVLTPCDGVSGGDAARATFELAPTGHLRLTSAGNYCVHAGSGGGATVQDCDDATGTQFTLAPVGAWAPQISAALRGASEMLEAAAVRQEKLLGKLQETLRSSGSCRLRLSGSPGGLVRRGAPAAALQAVRSSSGGPGATCEQKVDAMVRPGLERAKELISESAAVLRKA